MVPTVAPETLAERIAHATALLVECSTNLERLAIRDQAAAAAAAAAVMERRDVQATASVLVARAERAIVQGTPPGTSPDIAVLPLQDIRKMRHAHIHLDDAGFEELAARRIADAEPLTRSLLIRLGRARRRMAHVGQATGNDEWYTPASIVDRARDVLGGIDLDPASSPAAQLIVGARRYFTVHEDGLAQPWAGNVWLNPPYSREQIARWVDRLLEHHTSGHVRHALLLVNNATETRWFQRAAAEAQRLCLPRGRIEFVGEHARRASDNRSAPLQGQVLMLFTVDDDVAARFAAAFESLGLIATITGGFAP